MAMLPRPRQIMGYNPQAQVGITPPSVDKIGRPLQTSSIPRIPTGTPPPTNLGGQQLLNAPSANTGAPIAMNRGGQAAAGVAPNPTDPQENKFQGNIDKPPMIARGTSQYQDIRQQNLSLREKLKGMAPGSPQYNKVLAKLNANRGKIGIGEYTKGQQTSEQQPPAGETAPAGETPAPVVDPGINPDYLKIMFPDTDPYAIGEGWKQSPTYNFRLSEGQKALDRLMASRGLTKSGAEVEANSKFINQLSGEEENRAYDLRQSQILNNLNRGGNFQNFLNNEANRGMTQGQNQFDNLYKILALQADQDPSNMNAEFTKYGTELNSANSKGNASAMANDYKKHYGTKYSAGGYTPPYPGSPNTGIYDAMAGLIGGGAKNDGIGAILSSLGGFFK